MSAAENIRLKVFNYIKELDCFLPAQPFADIVEQLKISDWSGVEWIGRYFTLDNDHGEHWFDNWPEREALEKRALAAGYESELLLIIDPERFSNKQDGPCHSSLERKQFWTDVLISLELSLQTLFNEALRRARTHPTRLSITDTEHTISTILNEYTN